MAKIIINIDMDELTSGINQVVDEKLIHEVEMEEEVEDTFSCPLSTQDEDLNAENREMVVQEYSYGPSTPTWENKGQICGHCEYYNIQERVLGCIEDGLGLDGDYGYCTKFDFSCQKKYVCNAFEKGGPITDMEDIDDLEPIEGGSKDIF